MSNNFKHSEESLSMSAMPAFRKQNEHHIDEDHHANKGCEIVDDAFVARVVARGKASLQRGMTEASAKIRQQIDEQHR